MLQLRKDQWTAVPPVNGHGMQGCAVMEFKKYRELLARRVYQDVGATVRTFRIVADSAGNLFLRIEGDPGICLVPVTAKPEDIDADS